MAFSKVIFNGQTLMDVTQDTVTAGKLVLNETATKADGTKITGILSNDYTTYYTGPTTPLSSFGENGDVYLQT